MIDQEFVDEYKQLLILQYSDSPKAMAEITAKMEMWSRTYDFFNNFINEFDLDQAYGDRLDIIGKIVGVPRIVPEAIAKTYFAFSGTTNGKTFGEGKMFDIFLDGIYADTELNDEQYKFFIRSKIAKDITSSYMTSDDKISLQDTIQFLFSNKAFVVDNKDMSLTIYIEESVTDQELVLLEALDLIPKPQAVKYKYVVQYSDNTFGFSENPNSKTFGEGKFAELVI